MWRGIVVSEKIISTSSNLSLQNICEIGVGEFSKMSCTNYNDKICMTISALGMCFLMLLVAFMIKQHEWRK